MRKRAKDRGRIYADRGIYRNKEKKGREKEKVKERKTEKSRQQ